MTTTPPPPTFWDSLRRWLGLAPAEEPVREQEESPASAGALTPDQRSSVLEYMRHNPPPPLMEPLPSLEPVSESAFQGELQAVLGAIDTNRRNSLSLSTDRVQHPPEEDATPGPGRPLRAGVMAFLLMLLPATHQSSVGQFLVIGHRAAWFVVRQSDDLTIVAAERPSSSHREARQYSLLIREPHFGSKILGRERAWEIAILEDGSSATLWRKLIPEPSVRPSADPLDAERAITLWLFRQPAFQEALIAMVQWGRAVQALEAEEAARATKEVV